jgi:acetyl-CoA synthetase
MVFSLTDPNKIYVKPGGDYAMEISTDWLQPYEALYREDFGSYDELCDSFEWKFPETFNATTYLCDRWSDDEERVALIYEDRTTSTTGEITYRQLRQKTNRLANYLEDQGIGLGDRIAVNTAQKIETVVAHLGIWKTGAVSVPLSVLYGPDAIEYRLSDSAAVLGIVDESNVETYRRVTESNDSIRGTLVVGEADLEGDEARFWDAVADYSTEYDPVKLDPEEPMLILYSSGTTGPPKGILQPHRCVIGHLPGAITHVYNCEIADEDIIWIPSEWAWGASISNMFSALFFGRPILAYETGEGFDAKEAFRAIETYRITILWAVPSALRMMRRVEDPASRFDLDSVRIVGSGGESLAASVQNWAAKTFDATVHEVYGLSEAFNFIIGDCTAYNKTRPGWLGYELPGHEVAILDSATHEELAVGEKGEIAIRRDDPTVFKEYVNQPKKTADAFSDGWFLTGDIAMQNEAGRFTFCGRKDDLIISSGYRIGPEEIEESLMSHEAVAEAGVIGVPDEERGEIPKAFIVLNEGYEPSDELTSKIQSYVKENLAMYEYPRQIEFIDDLPRTTSGKVKRPVLRSWENCVSQIDD